MRPARPVDEMTVGRRAAVQNAGCGKDAMLTSYEIQTLQGGRWKISAIFDDRELAIYEAKRMANGQRYDAIRVVQENFGGVGDTSQIRVLYRSSGGVEEPVAGQVTVGRSQSSPTQASAQAPPQAQARAPRGGSQASQRKEPGFGGATAERAASLDQAAAAAALVEQSLGRAPGKSQGGRPPPSAPPMAGGGAPPMRRNPGRKRRKQGNSGVVIALIFVIVGLLVLGGAFVFMQLSSRGVL